MSLVSIILPAGYKPAKGKRICAVCGHNIGRHDKWHFRPDGRIQHRYCDNKEHYKPKETQDLFTPKT